MDAADRRQTPRGRALTLRWRLAIGTIGIGAVLAVPLLPAVRSLQRVHHTTLELRNGPFAASLLLGRLRDVADELRSAEISLLFVHDAQSRTRMATAIERAHAMADSLDVYSLHPEASHIRAQLDTLAAAVPDEYRFAVAGSDSAEALSSNVARPGITHISGTVATAEASLRDRTRDAVSAATEDTERANRLTIGALVLASILALMLIVWLIRSVSRPVFDLEAGMSAVASGDFRHTIQTSVARRDEFGRLARSYAAMTDRLAELDKLKADFISVASHELKTPINVILGYAELLDDGIYGEMSPKQREVCGTIRTQAQTLTRLVRRLLDVSRFEAGGRVECKPLELPRFVSTLESSFRVLAQQRDIAFTVETAALPARVIWDEDRMNEVLGNILSNAFKFTDRGGRVAMTVRGERDRVIFTVEDTGRGIPGDQLPHIFQKFYRAGAESAPTVEGTGLGLAIAKGIVDAHDGDITVTSEVARGTRFVITMPLECRSKGLPA